eukprot:Opistho-2@65009
MEAAPADKTINERALRSNGASLDRSRVMVGAVAGATAGILGLTNLQGFMFYFVSHLIFASLMTVKFGTHATDFFKSISALWLDGLLGHVLTFVLFWTLLFGIVHVF